MNTRKTIRALLGGVVLVSSCAAIPIHAKTLYVEKFGTPGPCSKSTPCGNINDALLISAKNDKILVGPGVYEESLLIETPGLALQSTSGLYVTHIRADADGSLIGNPAVTILSDKVKLGKKGGKGFTIRSRNAPAVVAGMDADPVTPFACSLDPDLGIYVIDRDLSSMVEVSGLRIEGNQINTHLDSPALANVPEAPVGCDMETVEFGPHLPSVHVVANDATILSNVLLGEGTVVADMGAVFSKVTFQDNIVKFLPETDEFESFPEGGVFTTAERATIKGNTIEDWRADGLKGMSGTGIESGNLFAKANTLVSNNVVSGFSYGISSGNSKSVEKNLVRHVSLAGIASFLDKKVVSNTINSSLTGAGPGFAGILLEEMNKGIVTSNNVSDFDAPGAWIYNPAGEALEGGGVISKFNNNNFYGNDTSVARCGVFIEDSGNAFKMRKNFYGDTTDPLVMPEMLESEEVGYYSGPAAVGASDAICVSNGLIDGVTGEIINVDIGPTNKPNAVKAIFKKELL